MTADLHWLGLPLLPDCEERNPRTGIGCPKTGPHEDHQAFNVDTGQWDVWRVTS